MTTTDWRELCANLANALDAEIGYKTKDGKWITSEDVTRARAALAQPEPALPQRPECFEFALDFLGRPENDQLLEYIERLEARAALAEPQPEVVGPTDEELLATVDAVSVTLPPLPMDHTDAHSRIEYDIAWRIAMARAVLARWGNHPAIPDSSTCKESLPVAPAPPAESEVGVLVSALRSTADGLESQAYPQTAALITRAAALLEQRHPEPVSVSERLPGPEDCDGEGFCWWFSPADPAAGTFGVAACWVLRKPEPEDDFRAHWLPAHALPLPAGEVK